VLSIALKSSFFIIYESLSEYLKTDLEDNLATGFEPRFFEAEAVVNSLSTTDAALAKERFRGRIDRLDVKKTVDGWEARVVEYKSGQEPPGGKFATALLRGRYPQLPIYMRLAVPYLESQGLKPVRVTSASLRWLRTEDLDIEKFSLPDGFYESPDGSLFLENLGGWIRLAREGRFFIEPNTGEHGHCQDCSFTRICRKEHMPTRHRAARDPSRLAYMARGERTAAGS
jgi:hypothetical protein